MDDDLFAFMQPDVNFQPDLVDNITTVFTDEQQAILADLLNASGGGDGVRQDHWEDQVHFTGDALDGLYDGPPYDVNNPFPIPDNTLFPAHAAPFRDIPAEPIENAAPGAALDPPMYPFTPAPAPPAVHVPEPTRAAPVAPDVRLGAKRGRAESESDAASSATPQPPKSLKKSRKVNAQRVDDDEVQIIDNPPDDAHGGGRVWSDGETTRLLTAVLGVDSTMYEGCISNNSKSWEKVSTTFFHGSRSSKSCSGRFTRLKQVYAAMKAYEQFTGGAGDADIGSGDVPVMQNQDADFISERINGMKAAKRSVESLSVNVIKQWIRNEWYKLFDDRLSSRPNITRAVEYHSGRVSPFQPKVESKASVDDLSTIPGPSQDVTTPKGQRTQVKGQVNCLAGIQDGLSAIGQLAMVQAQDIQSRQAERALLSRVQTARQIDADPNASPATKLAAQQIIADYLLGRLQAN